MTTADWAILISLSSLTISLASFVWGVWSKWIYPKPKVKVSMSRMHTFRDGEIPSHPCVALHATNFGPVDVTLKHAVAKPRNRFFARKFNLGILNPYRNYPHDFESDGPFSGGLPKKLEVGGEFSSYFPEAAEWFEEEKLSKFGYLDTFGRYHWCKKSEVKKVRAGVLKAREENDQT